MDVPSSHEVVNQETVNQNNVVDMRGDGHESEEVTVGTNIETVAKEPIVYQRRRFKSQGSKSLHHSHRSLSLQSQISLRISLHLGQAVMSLLSLNM